MTKEEMYIYACEYAVNKLKKEGSSSFVISMLDGWQTISWDEVLEWLKESHCR